MAAPCRGDRPLYSRSHFQPDRHVRNQTKSNGALHYKHVWRARVREWCVCTLVKWIRSSAFYRVVVVGEDVSSINFLMNYPKGVASTVDNVERDEREEGRLRCTSEPIYGGVNILNYVCRCKTRFLSAVHRLHNVKYNSTHRRRRRSHWIPARLGKYLI